MRKLDRSNLQILDCWDLPISDLTLIYEYGYWESPLRGGVTTCIFPKICNPCRIMNFWSTRMAGINLPNLNFDVNKNFIKNVFEKTIFSSLEKMFWKFSQTQGLWWFYYGESHSKITKSLEISENLRKKSKTFFRAKKKYIFWKKFLMIFF